MSVSRWGYQLRPGTIEELLESARGQALAQRGDDYDPVQDAPFLTLKFAIDLCLRVKELERQVGLA